MDKIDDYECSASTSGVAFDDVSAAFELINESADRNVYAAAVRQEARIIEEARMG